MAIRNMRKKIKPVIWIITIGFFLSMLTVIVSNISMGLKNKQYAFKVNGEKVDRIDLERTINNISSQYGQYFQTPMEREDAKIMAADTLITNELIKELGEQLKVKVSKDKVKEQINMIEVQFPDKEAFKRMLKAQGFTKKTLEKTIEDSILIEETKKKVVESTTVSEEELKAKYEDEKYRKFLGKTFEESKEELEKLVKEEKGNKELARLIEKMKKEAEIEDVREEYGNVLPTVEFEEEGFAVTNLDIIRGALYQALFGVTDYNEAKVKSVAVIKDEIKLAKKAMEKGAKRDESLPVMSQIMDLKEQLVNILKKDMKVSDDELKKFFEENKGMYNVEASADADIITFLVEPTDEDDAKAKEEAMRILKEVNAQNFAEMAKKYSNGPSAPNGGDLGWFGKGQMVPEFEEAAFKGNVGEVYSEVIKTKFGYHIIYVAEKNEEKGEVRAAHILIEVKPGEETYARVFETAKTVAEEIKSGKLTFEEASKKEYSKYENYEYKGIKKDGYIRPIGYEEELSNAIFASKINEVSPLKTSKGVYVFKKISEVKFEEAVFSKVKDRVLYDYKERKVMEELKNLK